MFDDPTLPARSLEPQRASQRARLCLMLLWSHDEPARIGEVLPIPEGVSCLGRGPAAGAEVRLAPLRQRPGRSEPTGPLRAARISRRQLLFHARGSALRVEVVGRCPTRHNGTPVVTAALKPGDMLELHSEALFGITLRPEVLDGPEPAHPFGTPDDAGIIGESPAAWALRAQIAFTAPRPAHVLIQGESGTGKELIARAIHAASGHRKGPLVARSAATIPAGLIDAELFGNIRDYPNPGMPERRGLIGEAHRGSLFLDEIGELPEPLQAHLLRILDAGEYHRLGEGAARAADLRLIAATNRPESAIKHDLLARLPLRIVAPPLSERPEDVPLIAVHLLREMAAADPALSARWLSGGWPRTSPALIRHLITLPYTTHVRQLQAELWASMLHSPGEYLQPAPRSRASTEQPAPAHTDPSTLTPEVIVAALEQCSWRQTEAAEALGLSSRHVLKRLLRKHGIRPPR